MEAPIIQCDGQVSCKDSSLYPQQVFCRGLQSCDDVTITKVDANGDGFNVSVSGYQGARDSFIFGAALIEATGAESITNAHIESAPNSEMVVIVSGQDAGIGAVAQCNSFGESGMCGFLFFYLETREGHMFKVKVW